MRFTGLVIATSVVPLALTGCGNSHRLGDGRWYGKLVSVSVAHRTLTFAPACKFRSGRYTAVADRSGVAVPIALRAPLAIYFRPGGNVVAGHGQPVDVAQLAADIAAHPGLPDSPPGWFVTVRAGAAVDVAEDSGITSSDPNDERTFGCVWSPATQAFVRK
jgi:hypothetical protein